MGWHLGLMLVALGSAGAAPYRVQAGDTLSSLARRSGVSVEALMRQNALNSDLLQIGQRLTLPDAAPEISSSPASSDIGPEPATAAPVAVSPVAADQSSPVYQSGMAVYYGGRADSRSALTAAHLTLPFGTWALVTHVRSGKSVLVLINDRGPFGRPERIIDLSAAAARELGMLSEGVAPVTLRIVQHP